MDFAIHGKTMDFAMDFDLAEKTHGLRDGLRGCWEDPHGLRGRGCWEDLGLGRGLGSQRQKPEGWIYLYWGV